MAPMGESTTASIGASAIDFDDSKDPLIVIRFSGEPIPLDEWSSLFTRMERLIVRGQPFGVLVDARRGLGASAAHRKLAADFIKRNDAGLRRHCRGVVTVSSSALVRGVITAIQWIAPPPFPDRVDSQIEPALRWLEQQLGRRP